MDMKKQKIYIWKKKQGFFKNLKQGPKEFLIFFGFKQ